MLKKQDKQEKEEKFIISKEKEGTRIGDRAELQSHRQAAIR